MICSFCKLNEADVIPNKTINKGICKECLYALNVQNQDILPGSVYCFGCKSSNGFILTYPNDIKVGFMYSGLDIKKHPIYTVQAVSKTWSKKLSPTSIKCVNCKSTKTIPLWSLRYNKYVRQSIEEPSTKD